MAKDRQSPSSPAVIDASSISSTGHRHPSHPIHPTHQSSEAFDGPDDAQSVSAVVPSSPRLDGADDDDDVLGDDGRSENIKVLVRIRPLLAFEADGRGQSSIVTAVGPKELSVGGDEPRHKVRCRFDAVLGQETTQDEVYPHVKECAEQCARGYNATIFAYGQTGSGKTHTMFGPPGYHTHGREGAPSDGIVPRAIRALFDTANALRASGSVTEIHVYCSFVQIYNENLFDMLRDARRAQPLEIHLDTDGTTYVAGLSEYAVRSAQECLELVQTGEENRAVRETHMNTASSRSHSLFQVCSGQIQSQGEGARGGSRRVSSGGRGRAPRAAACLSCRGSTCKNKRGMRYPTLSGCRIPWRGSFVVSIMNQAGLVTRYRIH